MGLAEEVVGPLRASVEGSFAETVLERMWELEALEGPIDLRLGEYLAMLFGPRDARNIDYTNFGVPVDVQKPDSSDTVDLADVIGG